MYSLSDFDFHLPPELIAQAPLPQRSASRLLQVQRPGGRRLAAEELLRGCPLTPGRPLAA